MSGFDQIRIAGPDRASVLVFLRLGDGTYFGGTTKAGEGLYHGPHCLIRLSGVLDLIGQLANEPGARYGDYLLTGPAEDVPIGRQMNAARIAAALGCSEQAVRQHYDALISLDQPAENLVAAEAAGVREEAWDSHRHIAPNPDSPPEERLAWYQAASHILALNARERCRRAAARAGDEAAARA